jgi:hypothetical protein
MDWMISHKTYKIRRKGLSSPGALAALCSRHASRYGYPHMRLIGPGGGRPFAGVVMFDLHELSTYRAPAWFGSSRSQA